MFYRAGIATGVTRTFFHNLNVANDFPVLDEPERNQSRFSVAVTHLIWDEDDAGSNPAGETNQLLQLSNCNRALGADSLFAPRKLYTRISL
jgi:hypothetical protein